ncbi:30S ribosomal protein S4 [bacterium]|nr:30S ribosomal protein S4 [bacterium]MCK4326766.1 30S ribosomal protein S4 [bacterium]MCK4436472.1 30S ribosomal protein S4 [bacterium]
MARYIGPICKLCRREGEKLFLKGSKCLGPKCIMERRKPSPGGGRGRRTRKLSDYGLRLREKQKLRRMYGILDRQFRRYFRMAERKRGITGEVLLQLLERRLDNIVFRLGFAISRNEARQLVRHGHFEVNEKRVNIPSYLVKAGDTIKARDKSKKIKDVMEFTKEREMPGWLELDRKSLAGTVAKIPSRKEIAVPVQEKLIVELLSR